MLKGKLVVTILLIFMLGGVSDASQEETDKCSVTSLVQNHLELIKQAELSARPALALGILVTLPLESRRDFFQALPFEIAMKASNKKRLMIAAQMELDSSQQLFIEDAVALSERMISGDIDEHEASLLGERLELQSVELFGEELARKLFSFSGLFESEDIIVSALDDPRPQCDCRIGSNFDCRGCRTGNCYWMNHGCGFGNFYSCDGKCPI